MVENLGQSWNHFIEHKRLNMMIEGNKLLAYLLICNQPNYKAPKAMHSLTDNPCTKSSDDEVHLKSCE
jgi:hypothetical protein